MTWQMDTIPLHRAMCKVCGAQFSDTNPERLGQRMDDHDTGCSGPGWPL